MALSGSIDVSVDDECVKAYEEMKKGHRWLYIIFRITDDGKRIIIDHKAGHDKNYDDFVSALKEAETKMQCRYAVFEVNILRSDGEQKKLVFFKWNPELAAVKQKLMYASSAGYLSSRMSDIDTEILCRDHEDLGFKNILETIIKNNC